MRFPEVGQSPVSPFLQVTARLRAAVLLLALTAVWAVTGNAPAAHAAAIPTFLSQPYVANTGGYDCYRLPAMVTTKSGIVLAFAEARSHTCDDVGDIDLVLRRSTDNGRTWEPGMQVLRGSGDHGGFGNPVPMVDRASGRVSVMFAYNDWNLVDGQPKRLARSLHILYSDDDGASRSWHAGSFLGPLKPATWNFVSVGPGHAVQLQRGDRPGRIVVGGEHTVTHTTTHADRAGAQLYYSDDGGGTWSLGATYDTDVASGYPAELTVAERTDGSLYVNARSSQTCGTDDHRLAAISKDQGKTFTAAGFTPVTDIDAPPVSGSLLQLRATDQGDSRDRLLMSAPSRPGAEAGDRRVMTVRSSYDQGQTWSTTGTVINNARAGYSDLTELKSGEIGLIYETANHSPHGTVNFTAFTEASLDSARGDITPRRTGDGSGNNVDAVVQGNPTPGARGSDVALNFDGADDHVRLINCPAPLRLGSDGFTVTAWIRYNATGGGQPIVWGYGQGSGVRQFWLRAEPAGGRIRAAIDTGDGGSSAAVSTTSAYNDNAWHHVVFRRQDGQLLLSVDGGTSAKADAPTGGITPTGAFTIHIGARPDNQELFTGEMDDVRIFNRSLTTAESDAVRNGATNVTNEQVRLGFTTLWH
ncbi:LamG-like jellyroll fold domain-containing protein [Streptosporangium subroseum]|uniref:LamG-like jellyroll fold domain-containing protein n=1 Tax=Streptosporangium subroseum TaxID=106412 RepID=UPI0030908CE8|nr:exo-alpha-sialidase [Streptosporangium subroseum]